MANIRIPINRLKKGMVITADVYTRGGIMIIPQDTVVTREVVELLTKHFVDDVMIEYGPKENETLQVKKGKQEKLKEFSSSFSVAEDTLSQNLKDIVLQDKDIDISALLDTVHTVVNKAEGDTNLCDMLFSMRNSSETLYAHSVNVALYGQLLARWVALTSEEIELVLLAGLLHDIGHLKYPETTQNSFSFHDELEGICHEKHPVDGYKILQNKTLDYRIKQAVLTHHERMDEKGFPMGVSFVNINNIARILAIADTYATMTVEEKGHPVMSPFDILKWMQAQEFNKFDSRYLLAFIEHIAQSFIQHKVLLNNGQCGTIIMLNKFDLTKPLIQVEDRFVDLAVHKDLIIKEVLDDEE